MELDRLHTTDLGQVRIRRNLQLNIDDVVSWCKQQITADSSQVIRKGKNWYVHIDGCIITVNAGSYTIITAHKQKRS